MEAPNIAKQLQKCGTSRQAEFLLEKRLRNLTTWETIPIGFPVWWVCVGEFRYSGY